VKGRTCSWIVAEITVASLDARQRKLMENARIALERGQLDYALDATGEILLAAPACVAVRRLQREAQLKRFKTRGGLMARAAVWMAAASLRACADPKRAGRTLAAAEKLLRRDPTSVALLTLLAESALHLGRPETAAFAREARRELRPAARDNLIAHGEAWLAAGQPTKALHLAEEVLRAHPVDGPALELLRQASIAQTVTAGNWDSAGTFREKLRS